MATHEWPFVYPHWPIPPRSGRIRWSHLAIGAMSHSRTAKLLDTPIQSKDVLKSPPLLLGAAAGVFPGLDASGFTPLIGLDPLAAILLAATGGAIAGALAGVCALPTDVFFLNKAIRRGSIFSDQSPASPFGKNITTAMKRPPRPSNHSSGNASEKLVLAQFTKSAP